jgi:parallel beta-helix repeat protein
MDWFARIGFRTAWALLPASLLVVAATQAGAFPRGLNDWQARYGASSASGDNAGCQLCHADANGGSPWNAYGWDIRLSLADPTCDLNMDGGVTNDEAFFCLELVNSDGDGSGIDNATEIGLSTQPGWTAGPFNTLYGHSGTIPNQPAPTDIGPVDPDGTEPPPPPPPPPPTDDGMVPPGQLKRPTIVVRPGQSIQAAIDKAAPGTTIYILAGTYREQADPTNALNITKNDIHLIGQSTKKKRVILENAGNQRNGIVVVPEDRVDCMSCHSDLAPPFPTLPGTVPGLKMREPMMHGIEIRGITIQGFDNNGLFTENVDGFQIVDVESIDNRNYGIFPTLSKNGLITHSLATGSDLDSGIWVETSENVRVTYNLVEGNVNGFEVSNSDDILLAHNEARNNTVGMAILLLPDIFDDRGSARRIDMRSNHIHHNNRENTARPGSILAEVPRGTGILHLGVSDSEIEGNLIEYNDFGGVAIVDYCLAVSQLPGFGCFEDPAVLANPEFIPESFATNNRVVNNVLVENGTSPDPGHAFAFAAADLTMVSLDGGCFEGNFFTTFFSLLGGPDPPPCP